MIFQRRSRYLFLSLGALLLLSSLANAFEVQDIRVEGLQRITAGTVFNHLPLKPGDQLDSERTAELVRALYKTGYFKDVRLEQEDGVLVVYVRERPSISEINLSGNKSIEEEALLEGLKDAGLAVGRTFNRTILDRIEQELRRTFYNIGKYGVDLTSTVTPLERNRVALDIQISEGETTQIAKINIVGNERFEEEDLLEEFQLTTGGWLSFYLKDNQYSRQKLAADLETLRSYYLDRGYVNFKIESTQVTITPEKRDIYITINITEGDVFNINDIKLAGELEIAPEDLFPLIHLRRGEPFSRRHVVESTERINNKLADLGYAFANVNGIPEIDEEGKTVAVTFFVDPGKRVYVRRINISGNSHTRDAVVRREMRQMESAWFSSEKLQLSRERLQRTGFFEDVTVETPAVSGSTDQVDIDVVVEERPSGALLAGIGFSQSSGILLNASVTQENFLGTGKRVTVAFNNSDVNTQYQLSYTNPYYTVDGISRGFTLAYQETEFDELDISDFSTDTATAGVNFGIPLSEFNRLGFGFSLESIQLNLGLAASTELLAFVASEGNSYINLKVDANWRHDSRDSHIFPNSGAVQRFFAEASVPGSDLTYYKVSYGHRRYYPLYEDLTLSLNADVGYGDGYGGSTLPLFENFFGGGPKSLRGFQASTLGSKDSNGLALGGNFKIIGNAELLFPPPLLETKSVRLAAFFDVGNIYNTDIDDIDAGSLRYSVGVGASWLSPLGALAVSFAIPGNEGPNDETEEFQFTFGSAF